MSPRPPERRDAPSALLARLTRPDHDEYADAAARGRRAPGWTALGGFGVAVALLALLVTVSALRTQAAQSQEEQDRAALVQRIDAEQVQLARTREQAELLAADVESLRTSTAQQGIEAADLQDEVTQLGSEVGTVPVAGPGVRVTVDDARGDLAEGQILDTDLQLLVNGLWESGAEAVAVNGQRLTTLSAIRTAGQAITVNYRSLTPPYLVSAVGDPDELPARLLETRAGAAFTDLQANFGIFFEVEARDDLQLPATIGLAVRRSAESPEEEVAP